MAAEKPLKVVTPLTCGLVMPISSIDGCTAEHWAEVKSIITEAVEGIAEPKFSVKLVSDADDVGVIQKRIVQNIYSSDIVVCDVSGKNPNVMFELGMRLAFDKPTVIIKDDKTDYSFDTGIIEHVPYPRDLRFSKIVNFKTLLCDKVLATYRVAINDPNHSTFLKNFGTFQVANLKESVVPADKVVIEMLSDLQNEVMRLRRTIPREDIRRGRAARNEDGLMRLTFEFDEFIRENPKSELRELIGQESFYNEMEKRADAPRFYEGPDEFRRAVDSVVLRRIERKK